MSENQIVYEQGNYFVVAATFGSGRFKPKSHGFQVYEQGITHAKLAATIGYDGQNGLEKAKAWIDDATNGK